MHVYELTDEQFERIQPLLHNNHGEPGRDTLGRRPILDGIFFRLHNGCRWEDVPERYGRPKTVYDRFNTWSKDGTWDRILEALQVQMDEAGEIDWDLFCVDGTNVRAHKAAAGGGKKGEPKNPATTL
jgi:transposase